MGSVEKFHDIQEVMLFWVGSSAVRWWGALRCSGGHNVCRQTERETMLIKLYAVGKNRRGECFVCVE